ncbi:MAG: hypothetical protein KAU27_15885 [Desulfuromonadales bacterium]|nr:hypothetical protein [Desulfuromonadales bacterium]
MASKYLSIAIGTLIAFMLAAKPAQAVQAHGGVEGLVSHQIGHFLFAVGMGYLLYRLYTMQLRGTGWIEFKTFLWLLLLWNVMTFSGHWMNEFVARENFIKANGNTLSFTIGNFPDALFYLTRLDHLILVPSFVFLLLALRKWRTQQ